MRNALKSKASELKKLQKKLKCPRVSLGSAHAELKPNHPLRLIQIKMDPHQKRTRYGGKKTGPSYDGVLRIVTNLTQVPAEIIALRYQYHWTIEIFLRFFKHMPGCRYFVSQRIKKCEWSAAPRLKMIERKLQSRFKESEPGLLKQKTELLLFSDQLTMLFYSLLMQHCFRIFISVIPGEIG